MWPDMFGPGWPWGMLGALGLLAVCVGMVRLALRANGAGSPRSDPLLEACHRYEEGDLLRSEFERVKRAIAAEREPAVNVRTGRAVEARRPRSPAV